VLKTYQRKSTERVGPVRKRLWPWVVLLVVVFCAIYSHERVSEFLAVNADNLPILFFDFVLEYFLGEAPREGVTEI
jgi:predicted membrane protein